MTRRPPSATTPVCRQTSTSRVSRTATPARGHRLSGPIDPVLLGHIGEHVAPLVLWLGPAAQQQQRAAPVSGHLVQFHAVPTAIAWEKSASVATACNQTPRPERLERTRQSTVAPARRADAPIVSRIRRVLVSPLHVPVVKKQSRNMSVFRGAGRTVRPSRSS
jgi:hypothetical protein